MEFTELMAVLKMKSHVCVCLYMENDSVSCLELSSETDFSLNACRVAVTSAYVDARRWVQEKGRERERKSSSIHHQRLLTENRHLHTYLVVTKIVNWTSELDKSLIDMNIRASQGPTTLSTPKHPIVL